jgi:hypothetical protein
MSLQKQIEMREKMPPIEKPIILEKNKRETKNWNITKNDMKVKNEVLKFERNLSAKGRRNLIEKEKRKV